MSPESDSAFEEFMRSRSLPLFRTALLLCAQNEAEAEDLLQVVFERTWRHWPRVSRYEEPELYVRRALINAATDRWRRICRRLERPLNQVPDPAVGDGAEERATRSVLMAALANLPSRQRAVVVLRYWEGLSEREIAEAMGCSIGTVKSHASRALDALRTAAPPELPRVKTRDPKGVVRHGL